MELTHVTQTHTSKVLVPIPLKYKSSRQSCEESSETAGKIHICCCLSSETKPILRVERVSKGLSRHLG